MALSGANLLVSLPLIIWICTPYFESVPASIEESAMMDGCSVYGSFLKIMIPLSGPGICTAAILSFIYSWNNFMFALILGSAKTVSYTHLDVYKRQSWRLEWTAW